MRGLVVSPNAPVGSETGLAPLEWQEFPEPRLAADEVLIAIHAAGINRADLMQREGRYPPPPGATQVLGLEAAGTVVAVGRDVKSVCEGDRVCTLLPGGGYATHAVAPADLVIPAWDALDDAHAAALPEVFMTASMALFDAGRLAPGETVLVHAAASGVGTAVIQLASAVGCHVIATCGGREKAEACLRLGAEMAIDRHTEDFEDVIRKRLPVDGAPHVGPGGSGAVGPVDVVIDMVGRSYFEANIRSMAVEGRIVFVAAQSGAQVPLSIFDLTSKRLHLAGTTLRARTVAEKVALRDALLDRFGDDLRAGTIAPVVDSVFPIERVEDAHARMLANHNIGKVVLTVGGDVG